MFEDRRAHERLDNLEKELLAQKQEHALLETSIAENTRLTKAIEANTAELVILFKGASNVRAFFVWASPITAFFLGLWAFINWLLSTK